MKVSSPLRDGPRAWCRYGNVLSVLEVVLNIYFDVLTCGFFSLPLASTEVSKWRRCLRISERFSARCRSLVLFTCGVRTLLAMILVEYYLEGMAPMSLYA